MDATNEARISPGAPTKRRSFVAIVIVLAIAIALLAALSLWRVTATPTRDAPPASHGAVETVGAENPSIIGDHRSDGLHGVVPVPGGTQAHLATGPHPPHKDPKSG